MNDKKTKYILITLIIICLALIGVYLVKFNPNTENGYGNIQNVDTVLDKDNITNINIEIADSDWEDLKENATAEEYYEANVTINGETFYSVGVRAKGNSSLSNIAKDDTTDRYSLKIKFDKYVDGQTYNGIEKLALNNNYQDPTYMKEYLSYEIYESLGVSTPEYSYASISINGEPWGFYLAIEDIDERYIEKYYGSVEGNLYKPETMDLNNNDIGQKDEEMIKPGFQTNEDIGGESAASNSNSQGMDGNMQSMPGNMPENLPEGIPNDMQGNKQGMMGGFNKGNNGGADLKYIDDDIASYSTITESAEFKTTTEADYQKIVDMIKNLNKGENLEEYLNVEEILKYFAVNTFLVNLDSYSGGMYHNYYLYERDGVFEMLPWDLNMSFAGFGVNNASSAVNFPIDSPVTGTLEDAPLIGKLLEVDEYKELYHSYLNQIIENYISNDGFNNLVTKIDNMIKDYVKEDVTAFYNYDEYESAVSELRTFMQDRSSSVIAQLNGEQPSTEYGTIETTVDLSVLGGQQQMGMGGNKGGMFDMNNIPGNIDGQNIPQMPTDMNGENLPQMPTDMNGANIQQMPPNMNGVNMEQQPNINTNDMQQNIEGEVGNSQ
ncbi:CotH kinase family protein [Clostridium sp. NSJ-49]|uniref:CotH kinase family protein n=1 Tax=Clostridium TaxID=1485 RepID=UPI00164C00D1|nr:CotH kinase family protein [Clostridium sp. NSJ-49]MBC5625375.1 CotH kinase family protein [Clostridium sp. NSJ-49]